MTMRYTHIGLEDRSKAVSNLRLPVAALQINPALVEKNSDSAEGGALQMRCIYCSARSHSETLADIGEEEEKNKNPGQCQGYVAACHPDDTVGNVEAAGRQLNFSYKAYPLGTARSGDGSRTVTRMPE